jgi:hypothetical protein
VLAPFPGWSHTWKWKQHITLKHDGFLAHWS